MHRRRSPYTHFQDPGPQIWFSGRAGCHVKDPKQVHGQHVLFHHCEEILRGIMCTIPPVAVLPHLPLRWQAQQLPRRPGNLAEEALVRRMHPDPARLHEVMVMGRLLSQFCRVVRRDVGLNKCAVFPFAPTALLLGGCR